MSFFLSHKTSIIVFSLAVAVRIIFFAGIALYVGISRLDHGLLPGSDSLRYLQLGKNLEHLGIFSDAAVPPYTPEQTIEPLYPVFLAGIFFVHEGVFFAAFIQILLAGVSAIILYKIANLYFSEKLSWLAAILFIVEPVAIYLSGALFTETIFVPLFLFAIYLFLKYADEGCVLSEDFFASGVFLGLSALTRPEAQFLGIIFFLFFIVFKHTGGWKKSLQKGLVFLLGFYIILFPWLLRNKIMNGTWQTSAIGIHKLYLFDLLAFYSYQHDVSFADARKALREQVVAISPYKNDDPTYENAPYLERVAMSYISTYPVSFATFYIAKTAPFFLTDGLRWMFDKFGIGEAPRVNISGYLIRGKFTQLYDHLNKNELLSLILLFGGVAFWLIINVAMLAGVIAMYIQKNKQLYLPVALLFSLVIIFALMSGTVSNPRLRYKAEPLMFILAVYGLQQGYVVLSNKREKILQ